MSGDPHPGNLLVREHPTRPGKPQLVLLDHGLYIQESEEFRKQNALFWKSLFTQDINTMKEIARQWGIYDVDFFASMALQQPFNASQEYPTKEISKEDVYKLQMEMKKKAQEFLAHNELIPREIVLVGRNMNIVRALNKELNSPVNRLGKMAEWAVVGLGHSSHYFSFLYNRWDWWRFHTTLWALSLGFWWVRTRQRLQIWWNAFYSRAEYSRIEGFENILERTLNNYE